MKKSLVIFTRVLGGIMGIKAAVKCIDQRGEEMTAREPRLGDIYRDLGKWSEVKEGLFFEIRSAGVGLFDHRNDSVELGNLMILERPG